MGLLPRGDMLMAPQATMYDQPSKFSEAVGVVNAGFQDLAARQPHWWFQDCGAHFLVDSGTRLDAKLLPDAVHPSTEGMAAIATCLEPLVVDIIGH